ncbi:MAG: hypothetical protein HFJ41_05720 [Clostridia bacterium]|nr:hypothetical protein [Clostridia bacterium]
MKNEFKERANEIIKIYNIHKEFLIANVVWKEKITYPYSKFYKLEFKTAEELVGKITIMIRDAIKCFKQQSRFKQRRTENLLDELDNIQRQLSIIYTFGMK